MSIILTKEQKDVIKGILKDVKKQIVTTLSGCAGSGKTTTLKRLAELLPGFAVCSFTGKAVNVLRKKGIEKASTIHSLIYSPIRIDDKIEFELKAPYAFEYDGFIIDEAGMLSKELYDDILSFNKPMICIGDHAQLEPVGTSFNLMKDPMYKLETIHRNAGEIAYFANHIRCGNSPTSFPTGDKVKFLNSTDVTNDLLTSVDQIICAFNKFRIEKNNEIRHILGYKKLVEVGEKIICLRNNKRLLLFNGMQGVVTRVHNKYPQFDFKADDTFYFDIRYDRNQFGKEKNEFVMDESINPFDYSFCVTAHKMQGDEANQVLVYDQYCSHWDMIRWQYSVASRAKEKVYWASMNKKYIPVALPQKDLYIPDFLK